MVHGLSCSAACGIFPDQGLNLCPLQWQVVSQPLHHQGSPTNYIITSITTQSLSLLHSSMVNKLQVRNLQFSFFSFFFIGLIIFF